MGGRYQPREIRSLRVLQVNRWRLKGYQVTLDSQSVAVDVGFDIGWAATINVVVVAVMVR